jgi:cephalosporin hydroxylase
MHAICPDLAREKLAAHDIDEDEIEQVLQSAHVDTTSRSTGMPLARGWTDAGRWLVVIDRVVDGIPVEGITAYEPS